MGLVLGAHVDSRRIRVFLSSPSDVTPERERVARALSKIESEFGGRVVFDLIRWEHTYFTAASSFQDQIALPSTCDIVLCLFWRSLGTELPPAFNRPDGSPRTGTEFEFEEAMEASQKSAAGAPQILVYRKTAPITFDEASLDYQRAQKRALDGFWERWFRDEKGHLTAGFHNFEDSEELAGHIERHISAWLHRDLARTSWDPQLLGSPFCGLLPFDERRAPVFFGRARAIEDARARLIAARLDGDGFLLLIGASGAGKSSLVRAGLIPRITSPESFLDFAALRYAIVSPSALTEHWPVKLAGILSTASALPELLQGDFGDAEALGRLMENDSHSSLAPIAAALGRASSTLMAEGGYSRSPKCGFLLVIDQLEEVFLWKESERNRFFAFLSNLAQHERCFVVATLRSDMYVALQSSPILLTLKEAGRTLDLPAPSQADIREIIRRPVEAAGLQFEKRPDGSDLGDAIEAEGFAPGALPMVQFLLDRLYDEREQTTGTLLYSTYERLGGATGALAAYGETILAEAEPETAAAFSRVVRGLVTIGADSGAVISQPTRLDEFALGSPSRRLVDRLVSGRLLVVYGNEGETLVRVAHEALLSRWPRIAAQIQAERRDLETRTRLEQLYYTWRAAPADEKPQRLLTGLFVAEGADLLQRWPDAISPDVRAFIEASQQSEAKSQKRRQRIAWAVSVGMAVLALFSVGFGGWAWWNASALDRSLGLTQGVLDAATGHLISPEYSDIAALEPLQRDLLNSLMPFYQRLLRESGGDPAATTRYARSLISLARLKSNYDSMASAEREFATAYDALWALRERRQLPSDFPETLALAASGYAEQLVELGERARAREVLNQSGALVGDNDAWRLRRGCALIGGDPIFEPLPEARELALQVIALSQGELGASGLSERDHALCLAVAALLVGEAGGDTWRQPNASPRAQPTESGENNETPISPALFDRAAVALDAAIVTRPQSIDLRSKRMRIEILRARWLFGRAVGTINYNEMLQTQEAAGGNVAVAQRLGAELEQIGPESRRRYADQAMLSLLRFEMSVLGDEGDLALERLDQWLSDSVQLARLDPNSIAVRGQITQRIRVFASMLGRTNEVAFGLPACRRIYVAVDVLESAQPGGQFLEASLHAAQCLLRLHALTERGEAEMPADYPDDSAIFAATRQKWSEYLSSPLPPDQMLEAATWRLRLIWEASSVGRYGVDSLRGADTILNEHFPDAIGPRYLLSAILVREAARLVAEGKFDEARTTVERCFGPTPLSRAICASSVRGNTEPLGGQRSPWLQPIIEGSPEILLARQIALGLSHSAPAREEHSPETSAFGTLFGPGWAEANENFSVAVVAEPIDGHVIFADAGLQRALGQNVRYEAGESFGELAGNNVIRYVQESEQSDLNPISAFRLATGGAFGAALALGWEGATNPSSDPAEAVRLLGQARVWLDAPERQRALAPYLTLYRRVFGEDWSAETERRPERIGGLELDADLLDEKGVILLQGRNTAGDRIYTYLELTLRDLIRLRDVMRAQQDFEPADYGTIVAAGRGDVPMFVRMRLEVVHNMTDVPRPAAHR